MVKIVIFAILCSKPAETKANRHQKIRKHFAISLLGFGCHPDRKAK